MYNTSGMCSLIERGGHGAKVLKLIVGNEISSVSTRKIQCLAHQILEGSRIISLV